MVAISSSLENLEAVVPAKKYQGQYLDECMRGVRKGLYSERVTMVYRDNRYNVSKLYTCDPQGSCVVTVGSCVGIGNIEYELSSNNEAAKVLSLIDSFANNEDKDMMDLMRLNSDFITCDKAIIKDWLKQFSNVRSSYSNMILSGAGYAIGLQLKHSVIKPISTEPFLIGKPESGSKLKDKVVMDGRMFYTMLKFLGSSFGVYFTNEYVSLVGRYKEDRIRFTMVACNSVKSDRSYDYDKAIEELDKVVKENA